MFEVRLHRRVLKFLERLNEKDRKRLISVIEKLSDPFSHPYEKLKGRKNVYRIAAGNYRVIYHVDKRNRVVSVLLVDKRERVYDRI